LRETSAELLCVPAFQRGNVLLMRFHLVVAHFGNPEIFGCHALARRREAAALLTFLGSRQNVEVKHFHLKASDLRQLHAPDYRRDIQGVVHHLNCKPPRSWTLIEDLVRRKGAPCIAEALTSSFEVPDVEDAASKPIRRSTLYVKNIRGVMQQHLRGSLNGVLRNEQSFDVS
jgi:hypothetical protein